MKLDIELIKFVATWIYEYIKFIVGFLISERFRELIAIVIKTYRKVFDALINKVGIEGVMAISVFFLFGVLIVIGLSFA